MSDGEFVQGVFERVNRLIKFKRRAIKKDFALGEFVIKGGYLIRMGPQGGRAETEKVRPILLIQLPKGTGVEDLFTPCSLRKVSPKGLNVQIRFSCGNDKLLHGPFRLDFHVRAIRSDVKGDVCDSDEE